MEQSTIPSVSLVLQRIQRIRQSRNQEQLSGTLPADAAEYFVFSQEPLVQMQKVSMAYDNRPEAPKWTDFNDWFDVLLQ